MEKTLRSFEEGKRYITYIGIELLVSLSLTLPNSNTSVEQMYSLTNLLWTDERNRFQLDTVMSVLTIKIHKHLFRLELLWTILKKKNNK